MNNCYFCGAYAPELLYEKGIYRMTCTCGASVRHWNRDLVEQMWDYNDNDDEKIYWEKI